MSDGGEASATERSQSDSTGAHPAVARVGTHQWTLFIIMTKAILSKQTVRNFFMVTRTFPLPTADLPAALGECPCRCKLAFCPSPGGVGARKGDRPALQILAHPVVRNYKGGWQVSYLSTGCPRGDVVAAP